LSPEEASRIYDISVFGKSYIQNILYDPVPSQL
jgi:hypothetical protein